MNSRWNLEHKSTKESEQKQVCTKEQAVQKELFLDMCKGGKSQKGLGTVLKAKCDIKCSWSLFCLIIRSWLWSRFPKKTGLNININLDHGVRGHSHNFYTSYQCWMRPTWRQKKCCCYICLSISVLVASHTQSFTFYTHAIIVLESVFIMSEVMPLSIRLS